MKHSYRIYLPTAALLISSIACAIPAVAPAPATSTPIDLNAAIVQTVAALTMNAPTETSSPTPDPTATFTITIEPPTITPTETLTATLEFTSEPSVTLISVSVPTNCRSGPGKAYRTEGSLLVGETAEVFGVDPTDSYWYIRNPDSGAEFCWVWGEYATFTGSTTQIAVLTPPPAPTDTMTSEPTAIPTQPPSFSADYVGLNTCNGQWWVNIKLKNTSTVTFKSVFVSIKNKITSESQAQTQNGFTSIDNCQGDSSIDTLAPGASHHISTPAFNHDLKGQELKITVTLCSESGSAGRCSTRGVGVIP